MRALILFCISLFAMNAKDEIYGINQIYAINSSYPYQELFTYLQGGLYVTYAFVISAFLALLAMVIHYKIVGPKVFKHEKLVKVYSKADILMHWLTAIPFVVLVLSGVLIVCIKLFGYDVGGEFMRFTRKMHDLSAIVATPFIVLMLIKWIKFALPKGYDFKWLMMMGGYLSKEKKLIPAGKFNAGQKMWFYIAIFGGLALAFTGYEIYFLEGTINYLRVMILVHLLIGLVATLFLMVHIYMSVFVVKGDIHAMIDGKIPEEEIKYLHNEYYKELETKCKD